jgi:hypothetical protein
MKRFYKEIRPELTRRPQFCSFICYALFRAATCVRFQKSNRFDFLSNLSNLELRLFCLCQNF